MGQSKTVRSLVLIPKLGVHMGHVGAAYISVYEERQGAQMVGCKLIVDSDVVQELLQGRERTALAIVFMTEKPLVHMADPIYCAVSPADYFNSSEEAEGYIQKLFKPEELILSWDAELYASIGARAN